MLQPIQSMRLYRFVTSGQQPYPHWWFPSMEEVFFPTTGGKPRAILPLVSHLSHQFRKKCSAITSTSTESSNSMFLSWTLIALAVNSLHLVPGWHSTLWSRNLFCGSNMNGDIQTGRATVFFQNTLSQRFLFTILVFKTAPKRSSWHFETAQGLCSEASVWSVSC